jgi:hypothetical protein
MSFNRFATDRACWRPKLGRFQLIQCALLIVVLTFIQNARARATDIMFDPIPVNVQGLTTLIGPNNRITVICNVSDASGNVLKPASLDFTGSHPGDTKLDANGNFSGNLAVGITFQNPNDLSKAQTYKCDLYGQQGGTQHILQIETLAAGQWYYVKSGNLSVSGPVTSPSPVVLTPKGLKEGLPPR